MATAPKIDVRNLKSVRQAAEQTDAVILGDDWVVQTPREAGERRRNHRSLWDLRHSPLARKIVLFNLIGLVLLVIGVLVFNPSRDKLAQQRATSLVSEVELIADVFEAKLPANAPVNMVTGDGLVVSEVLAGLDLRGGVEVHVLTPGGVDVGFRGTDGQDAPVSGLDQATQPYGIVSFLDRLWGGTSRAVGGSAAQNEANGEAPDLSELSERALRNGTLLDTTYADARNGYFIAATPVEQADVPVGTVVLISGKGELNTLIQQDREQLLRVFLIAAIISVGLSLVLASTIANPLSEMSSAVELSQSREARNLPPERVRIPDLSGRPDEIGRLSGALRGMVGALGQRIESNEQFAADVAHEIKNPLASMRSAVGTLRLAKNDSQRERLLEVLEHDVKRLDRLVSDISNASRLDSELVKEREESFDLIHTLTNITDFLGNEADDKGIKFTTDMPDDPLDVVGLEGRLAQVFVNLITNAISFCENGDSIRVWVRKRENRVLVVVEDTGPGIPDEALTKVFDRFYSERPEGQFGNNSGLGLAISKQIVEAHGGVIWAENIRGSDAARNGEPLGARFVVGLPV